MCAEDIADGFRLRGIVERCAARVGIDVVNLLRRKIRGGKGVAHRTGGMDAVWMWRGMERCMGIVGEDAPPKTERASAGLTARIPSRRNRSCCVSAKPMPPSALPT